MGTISAGLEDSGENQEAAGNTVGSQQDLIGCSVRLQAAPPPAANPHTLHTLIHTCLWSVVSMLNVLAKIFCIVTHIVLPRVLLITLNKFTVDLLLDF